MSFKALIAVSIGSSEAKARTGENLFSVMREDLEGKGMTAVFEEFNKRTKTFFEVTEKEDFVVVIGEVDRFKPEEGENR